MLFFTFVVGFFACDTEKSVESDSSIAPGWADYQLTEPTEDMRAWLQETPVQWPSQTCYPFEEGMSVDTGELIEGEDGTLQVCFWNHVSGAVPDGEVFGERADCNIVRTQVDSTEPAWRCLR